MNRLLAALHSRRGGITIQVVLLFVLLLGFAALGTEVRAARRRAARAPS